MTEDRQQTPPEPAVSGTELATFTRQLGAMLAANVSVLRALPIASHYTGNDRLIRVAQDVTAALTDGREFHQALGRYPELFGPFYLEMARQGEADGTLGESLLAVADYLDHHDLNGGVSETGAVPPESASTHAAGTALGAVGALSLGTGVLWTLSAAGVLPIAWVGPLAALWAGLCLLGGAARLTRSSTVQASAPLPPASAPKSPERRRAEADGLVRNALLEEQDAAEAGSPSLQQPAPGPVEPAIELNGKGEHDEPRKEPEPPRFTF